MRKLVKTQDLVVLYIEKHLTLREIGQLKGMSATAVMKRLRSAGITREQGERVERHCAYCGITVSQPRSQSHNVRAYCSNEHYYAARSNPQYVQWRQGGRLARAIVSQHYRLSPIEVVHHKDGNQRHNDLANLEVYATQADHLAMHHGRQVVPVWDGALVYPPLAVDHPGTTG